MAVIMTTKATNAKSAGPTFSLRCGLSFNCKSDIRDALLLPSIEVERLASDQGRRIDPDQNWLKQLSDWSPLPAAVVRGEQAVFGPEGFTKVREQVGALYCRKTTT